MPKQATPGHHALESPERVLAPRPSSRQLQQANDAVERPPHTSVSPWKPSPHTQTDTQKPIILDTALLSTIRRFLSFAGCPYNSELNNRPTILLKVEYLNGTTGWVHGLHTISGQPQDLGDALLSYGKIQKAKAIINEENWSHMEKTLGFSKDKTLQFGWFDQMKKNMFLDPRTAPSPPCPSSTAVPESPKTVTTRAEDRLCGFIVGMCIGPAAGMAISISLVYGVVFGPGAGIGLVLGVDHIHWGTSIAISWLTWFL
ncbi:uncharacterized protein BDV17DRAFT_276690 [Aspergillus undulatus]|uniref:uncharacterized protein n=1 Tax=Aspergillus undulatus TaxID=1810928 RepID=UPI003CCD59EA